MTEDRDPSPPADVPLLQWGATLPMAWNTRDDGSVYVVPGSRFLTQHSSAFLLWLAQGSIGAEAIGAFHVPFEDGERGEARCQRSALGMVPVKRPWRRRRGNSWWPGSLEILRDRLLWSDHDALLELWRPHDLTGMSVAELGPSNAQPASFYWAELYLALCDHAGFLDAVRDNDFAASIHAFLCGHKIVRQIDGHRMHLGSERRYGDMLGAWRRCGESYLDFVFDLPGEPDQSHAPIIVQMLDEAGFRAEPSH